MTIEEFSRHMKDNEKFSQPYKKISSATPEEIREWCDWTGSFTCGWGIF